MTDKQLNDYCESSAFPFDIVRLFHSTLREDLRNDLVMSTLEELATKHELDIIELAEQANEHLEDHE
jgi:hypothetical protein